MTLFAQQYLMLGATALGYWLVTRRHWRERDQTLRLHLSPAQSRAYSREFFDYSHPLFVQALLSFLLLTAERWLLQWFDGSAEQGFFALSQKVSMACFLFVSAMTPLIMRELSIAWGRKDRETMARLLTRFAPLLYVVAAYFSCFTLAEGPALVNIFGGAQFAAAILPVQIMALYPLHQPTANWPVPSFTPQAARACCAISRPWNAYTALQRPGFCWRRMRSWDSTWAPWVWP